MIDQWKKGAKYWDKPFNPVIGCVSVSEGCENCYASAMCKRFDMNGDGQFAPTAKPKARPPKSGVVFVGNMTDLFGEWNSDEQILTWLYSLSVKAVNLVLTKRADRMAMMYEHLPVDTCPWDVSITDNDFPIFYGITAENQSRFTERMQHIQKMDDCHKWLSAEPLLGEIELDKHMQFIHPDNEGYGVPIAKLFDWVVVGAESGANRRPCKLEWVEKIVESCECWGVPVFVKQLDIDGELVKDINKFPERLQIRQMPWIHSKQKGRAGR